MPSNSQTPDPDHDPATTADSSIARLSSLITTHSVAAIAVTTFLVILTIAGLLWTGTALNTGIEAPSVVAIPTPWAAAIIGAGGLTILLAFLAFAFAYETDTTHTPTTQQPPNQHPDPDPDAKPQPKPHPDPNTDNTNTVTVGTSTTPRDEQSIKRRVDDNYPDHLSNPTQTHQHEHEHPREQNKQKSSEQPSGRRSSNQVEGQRNRNNVNKAEKGAQCTDDSNGDAQQKTEKKSERNRSSTKRVIRKDYQKNR